MSDIFQQEQNIFQSLLPQTPEAYGAGARRTDDQKAAELLQGWDKAARQKKDFRDRLENRTGVELSRRNYNLLYDMYQNGIVDDDYLYRYASSKEIGEYLGLDPVYVMSDYNRLLRIVSGDREDRYATPQSRAEAIASSIQIAKNMNPLGKMGTELRDIHGRLAAAKGDDQQALQQQADELWQEITSIQEANRKLSRGMPSDPLSFIIASTIQSAPLTGKAMVAGAAGAAAGAAIGAMGGPGGIAGGMKMGYTLGSFAASSAEMTGLMYVDLLAAGVEREHAAALAAVGGSVQGLVESGLGVVAGLGGSAIKAIGGRALSAGAKAKIAEAASKSFIKKITTSGIALFVGKHPALRVALETAWRSGEEGIEEVFQTLTDQAMVSLGDAMQTAPVERDSWFSPEFQREMRQAFLGGIAGGIGFGIVGLPLNAAGSVSETARQTAALKNAAIAIDDKEQFKAAVKNNPMVKGLSDEQIGQIHDSQEAARREYHREEDERAEELKNKRLYGAMDQSGDVYRTEDGGLYMEHSRHTESGGLVTGEFAAGDPHKSEKNSYAIGEYELRGDKAAIVEFRIGQQYEGLRDEILQNFANDIGKPVEHEGRQYEPDGEGKSLRFGWGEEPQTAPAAPEAKQRLDFNRPYYGKPDTQADTAAKQSFSRRLMSLDTKLANDETAARTVVDFYDTVGRKWFGMGFDAFMNRLTGGNPDGLLTQELGDRQIAIWMAKNYGKAGDREAVLRIQENLTDGQRDAAKYYIGGFATPGADGITKAIYADQDADVSLFIHEGVHSFTHLAKALDPELHRQMMEAAGFDQEAYDAADEIGKDKIERDAMETLAYGAEAYLKEGPQSVGDSKLRDLYERIKEFLKDLYDAARKAGYLTPEVRSLFDGLFGDEARVDDARENAQATATGTQEVQKATVEAREAAPAELELYSEKLDKAIKDKNLSDEDRAVAVGMKAEAAYGDAQLSKQDRGHRPTAELIKRARRIPDKALRDRAVAEIRELRRRYADTQAEYMAPNGKPSKLLDSLGEEKGKEAWYAVRTSSFKEWFGEWEKAARIKAIENIESKAIKTSEPKTQKETEDIVRSFKSIANKIDGRIVEIPVNTIGKVYGHNGYNITQIVEHIPTLYETSVLGWSEPEIQREGHKAHPNIKAFHHYVNKFTDGTDEYFIRFTVNEGKAKSGKTGKNIIHSAAISDITIYKNKNGEGSLQRIREKSPGETNTSPYDLRLEQFFNSVNPDSVSKITDENGEPLAVFHRTNNTFSEFDKNLLGSKSHWGTAYFGFYFANKNKEGSYGKIAMPLFLNIRNPHRIDTQYYSDFDYDYKHADPEQFKDSDGIIIKAQKRQFSNEPDTVFVAFEPTQIKSATDNAGTYSEQNGNIYFSDSFPDAGLQEFISNYPEVVREAARFKSGAEMAEHYADYLAMPDEIYKKAHALGYFDTLARAAKAGNAEGATNTITGVSAEKAAEALAAYGAGAVTALEAASLARQGDWKAAVELLERQGVPRIDAETYADTAKAFSRPEMLWLEKQTGEREEAPEEESGQFKGIQEGLRDHGSEVMRQAVGTMASVLETGDSGIVTHEKYGDITVDAGEAKEQSFGLKHIISQRHVEGKSIKEITALLILLDTTLKNGKKTRDITLRQPGHRGRMELDAGGIIAIVSKQRKQGDSEQWVLTGFSDEESKEAADAIQKVISRYGYAPEFLGFEKQVGAVVSSLQISPKTDGKSSSGSNDSHDSGAGHDAEPGSASKPAKLGADNAAVQKFFNALVDGAKEIHGDENLDALEAELAGEPRTAHAFTGMIYTEKGFDDFIRAAWGTLRDGPQRGQTEEETQRNETIYNRARAAFNAEGNWNWKTAFAAIDAGKKIPDKTKTIIQGMIRNRPLQYMEVWAMMTGDETWLPQESDARRIRWLDTDGLVDEEYLEKQSPEELERIGRRLSSERVKAKIDSGTLLLDDPELDDYEAQLKADMASLKTLIDEREDELKEYQSYLKLAEQSARKERMLLEQMAGDTSDAGLKASREQTKKTAKAQEMLNRTIEEMKRFVNDDLNPTQRAMFRELRDHFKERERIQAELKAIGQIRDIKKRNLRQILRKPDLKTTSVVEARLIEWVQSHFDSYEAVARFVGRGAKPVRELYNQFATNAEYREKLKKKLPATAYHQIERIVFKDLAGKDVRAYGELDARQRRALYRHLTDHQGIFEELGIDVTAAPREFSDAEYAAIREEMRDIIPADILSKLEGLLKEDGHGNRKFKVADFKDSDIQTLAGVVNKLRKEGREREAARQDARSQLRREAQEEILSTLEAHLPKNAAKDRTAGIAQTRLAEEKRSKWREVWFSAHNARRFFRMLEGGEDGYLNDFITQREYDAFDQENGHVFRRKEQVAKQFEEAGISAKDLARHRFELWNGDAATLDEMLTFYYAQFNERATYAVIFGNFATQRDRDALKEMADERDIEGQMQFEGEIARRYWGDMKKLDAFFAQEGNEKYRKVMDIIGRDYDGNYGRLKDFVAREYNEELGSEPYYMPLERLGIAPTKGKEFEQAMADNGLTHQIGKGFTKGRVDVPSWAQQPIRAGFYASWDRMVAKQEHLMAYAPLFRELRQIFLDEGSEALQDTLRRSHSQEAVEYVKRFISELAAPQAQEDLRAMDTMSRLMRGHYPAAVLGWRVSSILKQAIESPPPFFQYVTPIEYAAAAQSCLRQETRDTVWAKSVYMRARFRDPAMAVAREMEKLYMGGKLEQAEAALAKAERLGMTGLEWIDAVCVMPGWLAAYNRKLAELDKDKPGLSAQEAEAQAVRHADGVVRDCQPSSVEMDRTPMLKNKNPFAQMFMQFQTPIASIFQQLFIDAPLHFKQGRALNALWTWGIYALLAIVIGAMHDDDDDEKLTPEYLKKRGIDALAMPLEMIPIAGSAASYAAEGFLRDGKFRLPRRTNFPVVDSAFKTGNAITDAKWGKAASNAVDMFFYAKGGPAGLKQDIEKAIETEKWQRIFGIR